MPSAAWIAAAKKTPMEPVFYVACESVDAVNVTQNLASDWNAGTLSNVDVFAREGGGAGIRPKLFSYDQNQVTWTDWATSFDANHNLRAQGGYSPWFTAPVPGFLESVFAIWQIATSFDPTMDPGTDIAGWPANWAPGARSLVSVYGNIPLYATNAAHSMPMLRLGEYAPGASVPAPNTAPFHETAFGVKVYDGYRNIFPYRDANFRANFRAKTGTITTKVFDLGVVPSIPSRVLIEHMVPGSSSIVYTAQGSANGSTWTDLGTVSDGGELAPYRYYRLTAVMTSTGYHTPELYSIRVVGGNSQYVYIGDHAGEPTLAGGVVAPYLLDISSVSSKISLKDKPTIGDCTMTLAWMPLTSDLVQSTGKRRSVTVYLGFVGLSSSDYEPYFTGIWDGYTADPEKRTFTVKLRDVWKKFKAKVPEQTSKDGATIPINYLFGHALDGSDSNSPLNVIDAIVQVADLAKAPDRYIDKAAFTALKAASFSGPEWNVYRTLTEQKESDDLLKELAITAGVFLVPAPNGKLTPVHYDTAVAQAPTVTLDAAQIQFTAMTPDMADTVTRHNIYFNLGTDEQGRKLGGGNPSDYKNVYTTVGSTASVIAERDREEVVVGEWFDNWGLAASVANGTSNPLTKLADRLASWYTPVANVGGKDVATTKTTVQATNVPLRYYADVMPGKMVYVNNLRLPCPLASWEGFSSNVKFMVMGWAVDKKNFTLKLDLFQVSPFSYTANPTWYTYNQWDLYPQASSLALAEQQIIGADGTVAVQLGLSFTPPSDYRAGYYEVWVSDTGADWTLATTIPAVAGRDVATATIPARSGGNYQVAVVTVNARGVRQLITDAPQISLTVEGTALVPTPANTGLAVSGGGTTFTGRNCLLTWDASPIPASLLGGYQVEILSLADVVKRTVTVADAQFLYTYGMNLDDFAGTPAASFKVRISTVNRGGAAATPQTITVTNSAPAAPTALTASAQLMSVQLAATYTAPEDFDALEIWSSTSNDRATVGSTPTATIKTGSYTHPGLAPAVTRYYWIRTRDIYGQVSGWYPSSATGGVPGTSLSDPSQIITLLNSQVDSTALTDYLAGKGSFSDLVDTATPAALAGVGQAGVFATKGQMLIQADRQLQLKAGSEDVNTQITLLDSKIQLKASSADVSAQVDILSTAIGLKLNATGTVGAGMLISAPVGGKSTIQFWSDCLQVCMPDGTGVKPLLTTGNVGGTPSIGIAGNMFIDGSVSASKITAGELIVGTNVTMGPSATIAWSNVTSAPGNLAALDSTASTKLAGIAAGATVGADWNTNVANKPTIPTVPSYITSTKITATTIESPTITAGEMVSGVVRSGQTAYATGTGYWLGDVGGVPKFSIGTSTSYMRWDGTDLDYTGTIKGDRIIRGRVAADGSIVSGTGFTITKMATGSYKINFTTAFADTPTVTTMGDFGWAVVNLFSISSSVAWVYTALQNSGTDLQTFSAQDKAFSFIAIGTK